MKLAPLPKQDYSFFIDGSPSRETEFGSTTPIVLPDGRPLYSYRTLIRPRRGRAREVWIKVPGEPPPDLLSNFAKVEFAGLTVNFWANERGQGYSWSAQALRVLDDLLEPSGSIAGKPLLREPNGG